MEHSMDLCCIVFLLHMLFSLYESTSALAESIATHRNNSLILAQQSCGTNPKLRDIYQPIQLKPINWRGMSHRKMNYDKYHRSHIYNR